MLEVNEIQTDHKWHYRTPNRGNVNPIAIQETLDTQRT